jgi:lipoate-protein ligase A
MYVLRGRAGDVDGDRERTEAIVERAARTDTRTLRVWAPHRQIAFGRRDARADGYDRARRIAEERGYPSVEREVGGRAVAYTGSTVAFTYADPGTERTAIESRYEDATTRLRSALGTLGVDARAGEPDGAFCPGTHSLRSAGKIAGLAQRVRRDVAVVGGIVVVRDEEAIADVLDPIYDALGVPFERDAVGSVRRAADRPVDSESVCRAIADAFADGDTRVEHVRET